MRCQLQTICKIEIPVIRIVCTYMPICLVCALFFFPHFPISTYLKDSSCCSLYEFFVIFVTNLISYCWFCRAENKFMLLPVSFIVIKSIKVHDKQCSDWSSNLSPTKDAYNASPDCLISQLHQCPSNKQIMLRCRVNCFTFIYEYLCSRR